MKVLINCNFAPGFFSHVDKIVQQCLIDSVFTFCDVIPYCSVQPMTSLVYRIILYGSQSTFKSLYGTKVIKYRCGIHG